MFGLQKAIQDVQDRFDRMGYALEEIQAIAQHSHHSTDEMLAAMQRIYDIAHEACPERGPDYVPAPVSPF